MSRISRLAFVALTGAALAACTDHSNDVPDVVGTWNATAATVTNAANASETTDLYAAGARFKATFNSDLTFQSILTDPVAPPDTTNGTYTETTSTLTLTDTGPGSTGPVAFALTRTGNTLTILGGTTTFDFGSGVVAAKLDITFVKQ